MDSLIILQSPRKKQTKLSVETIVETLFGIPEALLTSVTTAIQECYCTTRAASEKLHFLNYNSLV